MRLAADFGRKRMKRRCLTTAVVASLMLAVVTGAAGAGQLDRSELLARMDAIVAEAMESEQVVGTSIGVRKSGEIIIAKGYGYADLENEVRATEHTVYRIGSVTKQFTAALILRLVEAGSLGLSDTVSKHLPELTGAPVTVHQLLAHRSGLARDPLSYEEQSEAISAAEMLERINRHPR